MELSFSFFFKLIMYEFITEKMSSHLPIIVELSIEDNPTVNKVWFIAEYYFIILWPSLFLINFLSWTNTISTGAWQGLYWHKYQNLILVFYNAFMVAWLRWIEHLLSITIISLPFLKIFNSIHSFNFKMKSIKLSELSVD